MIELNEGINPLLPDATFDLDGTVFKMTVLEAYTAWLCEQSVFDPLPRDIAEARSAYKVNDTESTYNNHLGQLVRFFIDQVPGKSVSLLTEAAQIVANQERERRWNITVAVIDYLRPTHNLISVSLMPEWLMEPFTDDLGFVALVGSTYVTRDGQFTDEAHSIDKGIEYTKLRDGDVSMLDVHMGDTVGDISLFEIAKRPMPFNPSWTLLERMAAAKPTVITSHKDVVNILNHDVPPSAFGPPFDVPAILATIRAT